MPECIENIKILKYKKVLIIIEKIMPKNIKEQFVKSAIISFLKSVFMIKKDKNK